MKKRATPIERVVDRIFREAGANVRQNVFLKDMNVQVAAEDATKIEVLPRTSLVMGESVGNPCHSSRVCRPHKVKPSHMQQTGTVLCWSKLAARRRTHIQNSCVLGDASLWCWPSRLAKFRHSCVSQWP